MSSLLDYVLKLVLHEIRFLPLSLSLFYCIVSYKLKVNITRSTLSVGNALIMQHPELEEGGKRGRRINQFSSALGVGGAGVASQVCVAI